MARPGQSLRQKTMIGLKHGRRGAKCGTKKAKGESVRYFGSARCTYKKGKQEILFKVGTESKGLFWAPAAQFAEDNVEQSGSHA